MRSPALLLVLTLLLACTGTVATGVHGAATGDGHGGTSASGSGHTSGSGGATTAGAGAATTSGSTSTCTYPPVDNPPGCPPSYSFSYNFQPCSTPGLQCWYPGAGDEGPDGCAASAMLSCTTQFSDGGAAEWVAAQ